MLNGIHPSSPGGCRYDNLVGMFSGKQVPAVGISVGLERVFSVLEARIRAQAAAQGGFVRTSATQVLPDSQIRLLPRSHIVLAVVLVYERWTGLQACNPHKSVVGCGCSNIGGVQSCSQLALDVGMRISEHGGRTAQQW